ncbi:MULTISPECIES: hypothetical protein [Clostridia]|uniref:hypothetical protein n=1 Tax=Clostridium sp. CCUG 7971 TaxID=2811414 RepID=UPI001ABB645F|nr:hypothetical protein [Clostridium sp. CCUG 7971]MBO3444945.1 hypothetical protein [Clostridium sp. CCUG 7971]
MYSLIIFMVIFIPCFIFYNFWCIKNKKISVWISDVKLIDDNKLESSKDDYFNFQFKSSLITCLLMVLFILGASVLNIKNPYLLLILLVFHFSNFITKHLAIKKEYLTEI